MKLIKENKDGNFPTTFPTMISDFLEDDRIFSPHWLNHYVPAVNIKESKKEFNIELAVPGFDKEDFHVTLENNIMTISAQKEEEKVEEAEHFTKKEFNSNSIKRSFSLPGSVDIDKVDAKYSAGVLKVKVPKKEEEEKLPKKEIKVH